MGTYVGGGSGSGDTHISKSISGGKQPPNKVIKAVVVKAKAKPAKKAAPKKKG